MLSEEEKKAIERLEKRIKDNEDYKTTQVWLTDDVVAVNTVLNLIDKLQKETEEKDKQIDLMAEFISKYHCFEIIVYDLDDECKHEHECKDCIKQYFEKLAKEKGG